MDSMDLADANGPFDEMDDSPNFDEVDESPDQTTGSNYSPAFFNRLWAQPGPAVKKENNPPKHNTSYNETNESGPIVEKDDRSLE